MGWTMTAAAATCSNTLIKGIYGLTITGYDSANLYQDAVAQINANGKGTFTGIETLSDDGTIFKNAGVKGTYSVGSNCIGTGTIVNVKNGNTVHFDLAVDSLSGHVEFIGTDQGHGTASGVMIPQNTTCSLSAVKGTYGFHGGGYVVGSGVEKVAGQLVLDGAGNVSGASTLVVAGNVQSGSFSGKYTIAANCTGTLTGTLGGTTAHFNLVVDTGSKGFEAIETDTGVVTSITARQ
jgi:hypothetical protein